MEALLFIALILAVVLAFGFMTPNEDKLRDRACSMTAQGKATGKS